MEVERAVDLLVVHFISPCRVNWSAKTFFSLATESTSAMSRPPDSAKIEFSHSATTL